METESAPKAAFRVLVIDDNPFDAELIQLSLKASLACQLVVVETRLEFLTELERTLPDVIVSDSNIPSFDGVAALALAIEKCPQVPFIFCSRAEPEDTKARVLALGAKDWVNKENLDRLGEVVRAVCN